MLFVLQFFEKAAENVNENVGEDIQTDQLIKEACRNVLEHVRSLPVTSSLACVTIRAHVVINEWISCHGDLMTSQQVPQSSEL